MRHKGVILGLFAFLVGLIACFDWHNLLCDSAQKADEAKEEYREFMHTLTADMEAIQRKRRNAETN